MSFLSTKCNHCYTERIKLNVRSKYSVDITSYFFLSCEGCDQPTIVSAIIKHTRNQRSHIVPVIFNIDDDIDIQKCFHTIRTIYSENSTHLFKCPLHVPSDIENCFNEAAKCYQIQCYVACSSMLRLCLDLITKDLMKSAEEKEINNLSKRINHLIEINIIPSDLKDFAHSIRLDGNDAAHDGSTSKDEANDLMDFSILLLERIYTNKEKLRIAEERRSNRRSS